MSRTFIAFIAIALAISAMPANSADGQPPQADLARQKAEMAKLAFLTGAWHGTGWSEGREGRQSFRQTENIKLLQDGLLLAIEGRGFEAESAADAAPRFEANALVSFDEEHDAYRFYSFSQGYSGTFKAELTGPAQMRWYPGAIRFTITISGNKWNEVGERPDGNGGYVKFFEMNLEQS